MPSRERVIGAKAIVIFLRRAVVAFGVVGTVAGSLAGVDTAWTLRCPTWTSRSCSKTQLNRVGHT